jgi:hypothetical protein
MNATETVWHTYGEQYAIGANFIEPLYPRGRAGQGLEAQPFATEIVEC